MKLYITFNELSALAGKHLQKELQLEYKTPDTCAATISMQVVPFINKPVSISLNLTVEKIDGNDLYLAYSGKPGIDMLVSAALSLHKNNMGDMMGSGLRNGLGEGFLENPGNNRLILHLDCNEKLQKLLTSLTLNALSFTTDSLLAEVSFR